MMKHLKTLDGIRGLAAMYVLIHHARLALTQPYKTGYVQQPELYTWYNKVAVHILALFKFGNEAVLIFFVLSGFVIHLKHATPSYNYCYFSWKDFLKKRIIRIYPTLIASLLLCVLIDFLIHLFYGISIQQLFSKYTIASLTFNLLLIPDSEAWGVNAPIWSLKHEWFFYLTYPVLLCLSSLKKYYSLFLVIILAISYFAGLKIPFIGAAAYTISIWFLGCILAETYQMGYRISSIKYPMVLIFLYFILRTYELTSMVIQDILFGLIAATFLAIVIEGRFVRFNSFLVSFSRLGAFSYSLYLLHGPMVYLLSYIAKRTAANGELPTHLGYVGLAIVFVPLASYLIYLITERIAVNYLKKIK